MRFGIGYDIHRLVSSTEKSSIIVGGVEIPCFYRVEAHSDGDVLLHALVDACLGALALGDIGQWYPDNSEANKNRPSREFVIEVLEKVKSLGWKINQVDSILFLEEPKVAPHSQNIRHSVAEMLGVELSNVSVKAKTMERLGPIGERKALAAEVIVSLTRI